MFEERVQRIMDEVDGLRNTVDDHWQVPRNEALLLAQLVLVGNCRSICEIGTSYGYSTLHLAAAAKRCKGRVYTFDADPKKVRAAGGYLQRAGLDHVVEQHEGDAAKLIPGVEPAEPFDFVFFDAVKSESFAYLEAVEPKLAARAVLVTDNTLTHTAELADFVAHLRFMPGSTSCRIPIDNGIELTVLQRA